MSVAISVEVCRHQASAVQRKVTGIAPLAALPILRFRDGLIYAGVVIVLTWPSPAIAV